MPARAPRPEYMWPASLSVERITAASVVLAAAAILWGDGRCESPSAPIVKAWAVVLVLLQWPIARFGLRERRPLAAALHMGLANAGLSVVRAVWLSGSGSGRAPGVWMVLALGTTGLGLAFSFAPLLIGVLDEHHSPVLGSVDRALTVAGAWLAAVLFAASFGLTTPLASGLGVPAALFVAGLGLTVGHFRARWLRRVRRGEIAGWAVEARPNGELLLLAVMGEGDGYRGATVRGVVARVGRPRAEEGR